MAQPDLSAPHTASPLQPTDLIKCTEADIVSLKLKPAVQARFREGVSTLQAEQKPRTPTKARPLRPSCLN